MSLLCKSKRGCWSSESLFVLSPLALPHVILSRPWHLLYGKTLLIHTESYGLTSHSKKLYNNDKGIWGTTANCLFHSKGWMKLSTSLLWLRWKHCSSKVPEQRHRHMILLQQTSNTVHFKTADLWLAPRWEYQSNTHHSLWNIRRFGGCVVVQSRRKTEPPKTLAESFRV